MRKRNGTDSVSVSKGSSMVELVMVMTLMILFGVTIYTLIYAGVDTQQRIMNHKDTQTDARIALSYINVRLRQNDVTDKIAVENVELTGESGIVIRERTMDYEYDTWIFCYEGKLYECLVDPDEQPTVLESFYIAETERLEAEIDPENGAVTSKIWYYYGDILENISSTVYLRSHIKG